MPDLLSTDDPDYAAYNSGDPEFLLRSVGESIREYCGWHLAPSLTETLTGIEVGSGGIVMLPSRYVTAVASVVLHGSPDSPGQTLDPTSYIWHQGGYLEPVNRAQFGSVTGYWYEPGPVFLPVNRGGTVDVTFTHGYAALPANVKRVAFELAGWANGLGADGSGGDVKIIRSPGFELGLGGKVALGMNLNPDQKDRLANYKIGSTR